MTELLMAQASVAIALSAVTGLVFVVATAGAIWVYFKAFDDYEGNVRDVERFIELTNEARSLLPYGLPLFNPERAAATTDAIGRFQAKKDEARRALWQPRTGEDEPARTGRHDPLRESISRRAVGQDLSSVGVRPVQGRPHVSVRG